MGDYTVSALGFDGTVRAFAAVTTETVKKARELHGLSPVAASALGRTLTGAAMMSRLLKGENDVLTIQIKGDGLLGGIIAVSGSNSEVRGYVNNPEVYLPLNERGKLDVAGGVGRDGYLNIIRDIGMKEPYVGYVRLVSGEIAEDLAYYFAYSEQVPSVVSLGVLVDRDESILNSGGYLIQLMPGAEEGTISYLEDKINSLPSITTLLSEGNTPEDILRLIFADKELQLLESVPVSYVCNCSRERMERNILSLGANEIQEMIEEQHGAEAQCHFCNSRYWFSEDDLRSLLDEQR